MSIAPRPWREGAKAIAMPGAVWPDVRHIRQTPPDGMTEGRPAGHDTSAVNLRRRELSAGPRL